MTAGFGALYYTDCAPGQGLQGGAGFQFQAASAGAAEEAMPLVQRSVLYEPPAGWMHRRRPVADYPGSLAHVCEDGLLVTAAGRYLGRETNGSREGNQFTHALVTRDPAAYGQLRPAQLWAAPCWAGGPAPGTVLPPAPGPPAPGPLHTEAVRDRVAGTRAGEPLLVGLLSAVHRLADPARRRTVVLVTADPERAACWVAAATLLLPQPAALRASFKIFVADARYGRHDIIALHPEWAGPWADPDPGSGLAVFDLDAGRAGAVEPTAAARFWVPRFLGRGRFAGYDPYDVVDAVELAGQFARPDGEPTAGDRIAAAVVAAGERVAEPERAGLLAEWLGRAPDPVVQIARDAVLDALLAAGRAEPELPRPGLPGPGLWEPGLRGPGLPGPGLPGLRGPGPADPELPGPGLPGPVEPGPDPPDDTVPVLDVPGLHALGAVAAARGWTDVVPRLTAALLRAELAGTLAAADGVAALRDLRDRPHPPHPTQPPDATAPALEAALRTARPDQVPALLTLAARHGLTPRPARFPDTAAAFARWWLDRPDPDTAPGTWPAPPEALDWVRTELADRLRGPAAAAAERAIRDTWWRALHPHGLDPLDPVGRHVVAAALPHLDPAERERTAGEVLYRVFAERPADEPPAALAWAVLFGGRSPAPAEAVAFLLAAREHGSPLPAELADRVVELVRRERPPSAHGLWCAGELDRLGWPLPPALAELAGQDRRVAELVAQLGSADPDGPARLAGLLAGVTDPVLAARAEQLADALLTAPRELALDLLLRTATPPFRLVRAVERRWPGRTGGVDRPAGRAAALSFLLVREPTRDPARDGEWTRLRRRLADLVRELPEPARAAVDTAYHPPLGAAWRRWAGGLGSVRNRLLRGTRWES